MRSQASLISKGVASIAISVPDACRACRASVLPARACPDMPFAPEITHSVSQPLQSSVSGGLVLVSARRPCWLGSHPFGQRRSDATSILQKRPQARRDAPTPRVEPTSVAPGVIRLNAPHRADTT